MKQSRARKLSRVVYQDWIVDFGRDPDQAVYRDEPTELLSMSNPRVARIAAGEAERIKEEAAEVREIVGKAFQNLSEVEQEFVRQYYYRGLSYGEIAECTGRRKYRLELINRRVRRKLRQLLGKYAESRFGVNREEAGRCVVCRSSEREEIDRVIQGKGMEETWGKVMKQIKKEFGIQIKTPQELIGHVKYHGRLE